MYLGIDLGTSSVKAVLVDGDQRVVGQASAPLTVERPQPLWSEQDPEAWWRAADAAVRELGAAHPVAMGGVRGIGLSGQMHGATLLDASDRVLRPAILWNDGRSAAQCAELERRAPRSREITGNLAMPGFTAPKLLWVAQNEPDVFAQVARVLLPKDYLRLRMTGIHASEMSDAAGTLWLDVGRRAWSDEMLEATGLSRRHMPELFEGSAPTASLRPEVADAWGVPSDAVVAGGAGDNAAGAVGVGAVRPGQGFLSLGTSGVLFVAGDRFAPNPGQAVHAFCHALPDRWHQMAVHLSAASCLSWWARVTGLGEADLVTEAENAPADGPIFLPYLSGERTPHNDPEATGMFLGLRHETVRPSLTRAVLEGVAFTFADGLAALRAAGTDVGELSVIGGGARSRLWGRILADTLGVTLVFPSGGEVGPAFGAARLGRIAATGEAADEVATTPEIENRIDPNADARGRIDARLATFRGAYRQLAALRA